MSRRPYFVYRLLRKFAILAVDPVSIVILRYNRSKDATILKIKPNVFVFAVSFVVNAARIANPMNVRPIPIEYATRRKIPLRVPPSFIDTVRMLPTTGP